MTKSNLKWMNVPKVLWGEPVSHSVYILNCITTKPLKELTPYELWTGRKPNLDYVKAFKYVAYTNIVGTHPKKT